MRRVTDSRPVSITGRGFTLVEMIVSIVIAGVVLAMVGLFGRQQLGAYIDAGNRADLADAADTALRRVARDLQSALPNSVRQSGNFIEFVPILGAGRYRADVDNAGAGNILDFSSAADNSFDVLGPTVTINAGDQLVIFNLGLPGSDVYAGTSRRAATAGASLSTVTFTPAGTQFPLASPQSRFQIVGTPVTYECNLALGQVIRHSGYGFQPAVASAPWALGGTSAVLVGDMTDCDFSYLPAVLQRNGLVVLSLTLARNGEMVQLLHQVDIQNTP
jgi:MSHA biogenesis protein MshO